MNKSIKRQPHEIGFLRATLRDVREILAMMAGFNSEAGYRFNKARTPANLQTFILDPGLGALWTIRSGGITIGYLVLAFGFSFEYGGRDAFIDELYLKEEFRQQGIGRAALEFAERQAKELQVNVIHLEMEKSNKNAGKLYRNMGYTDQDRNLLSRWVSQAAPEPGHSKNA